MSAARRSRLAPCSWRQLLWRWPGSPRTPSANPVRTGARGDRTGLRRRSLSGLPVTWLVAGAFAWPGRSPGSQRSWRRLGRVRRRRGSPLGLYGLVAAVVAWFDPRRALAAGIASVSSRRPSPLSHVGAAQLGPAYRDVVPLTLGLLLLAWRARTLPGGGRVTRGRRGLRRRSRRAPRLASTATSPPQRSLSPRSLRSSSATRATADLASGLYLAPPPSASHSPWASPGCRCSRRERSWRSGRRAAHALGHDCARRSRTSLVRWPAPWRAAGREWRSRDSPGRLRSGDLDRLVARRLALQSLDWPLGGTQGIVIAGGPSPVEHYELALGLTLLAVLGYLALARGAARSAARSGARARGGRGGAAPAHPAVADGSARRVRRGRRPGRGTRRSPRRDRRPGDVRPVFSRSSSLSSS